MSSEERGRSSYLDLLITTLMEHEKNLDGLVDKLESIYKSLTSIYEGAELKSPKPTVEKKNAKADLLKSDTLVYMKIRLNRELDEVIKIIESLKE